MYELTYLINHHFIYFWADVQSSCTIRNCIRPNESVLERSEGLEAVLFAENWF